MKRIEENYRMTGLRQRMVSNLIEKGITDKRVIEAMKKIPRHIFLQEQNATEKLVDGANRNHESNIIGGHAEWAYKDQAFPILSGQTISRPFTVAKQTELLEIKKRQKVLEIGTGSGYQAAVLSELGAKVYTVERHDSLFYKTTKTLAKLGYNKIRTLLGDGFKGSERFAPFDRILVTCACPHIPLNLVKQLKKGGIMVIPVGNADDNQKMLKIYRKGDQLIIKDHGHYKFVPMVAGMVSV